MKHPIDTQVIKEKQTCLLAETREKNDAKHFILAKEERREEDKAQLMGFHQKGKLSSSQNLPSVFAFQWEGATGRLLSLLIRKRAEKRIPINCKTQPL